MTGRKPDLEVEQLLTPAEIAALFRVDPETLTRWAKLGKLRAISTLGSHRRYRETDVRAALADVGPGLSWDPRRCTCESAARTHVTGCQRTGT